MILLDEPFAGLDLGARERLLVHLAGLAADPASPPLVLVTHHCEEIPPGFTHGGLVSAGRVIAAGPLDEVITSRERLCVFRHPGHGRLHRWPVVGSRDSDRAERGPSILLIPTRVVGTTEVSGEVSTRSALCISPPSTTWKEPFIRLFRVKQKVGRRGSDDFDPASSRSAVVVGSLGTERVATIWRTTGRGFDRPFPPPAPTPRTRRTQDGLAGISAAHGAPGRRPGDRVRAVGQTLRARSSSCCGPPTTRRRRTWTTAKASTTSGWAFSTGPEPACLPEVSADLAHYRREQARNRCTVLLRCLGGVAISTGLIGIFPGLHLAWIFTVLSGVAALALVGLIGLRQRAPGPAASGNVPAGTEARRFADPGGRRPSGWLGRRRVPGAPVAEG